MLLRKGQGGAEYLMTFGWAILVVVVVGVLMWQLGIFEGGGALAAPGYQGFGTIKPLEWGCKAETGELTVSFINTVGASVGNVTFEGIACDKGANGKLVPAGDTILCRANAGCNKVPSGERFEAVVSLSYVGPGGILRKSSGTLWGASE